MIENRVSYKYAKDVLEGKVIACTYVKKACERFFNDLKNPDYYFNEEGEEQVQQDPNAEGAPQDGSQEDPNAQQQDSNNPQENSAPQQPAILPDDNSEESKDPTE